MTKLLSISSLLLTLSASSFAITALPDGSWMGGGTFTKSDGTSGPYTETLTIKNNAITKVVTHDGKSYTTQVTVSFDKNNFITSEGTVTMPDGKSKKVSGEGFCATSVPTCTWYTEEPNVHFGGVSYFGADFVSEVGGAKKGHPALKVRWDGKLTPVLND